MQKLCLHQWLVTHEGRSRVSPGGSVMGCWVLLRSSPLFDPTCVASSAGTSKVPGLDMHIVYMPDAVHWQYAIHHYGGVNNADICLMLPLCWNLYLWNVLKHLGYWMTTECKRLQLPSLA